MKNDTTDHLNSIMTHTNTSVGTFSYNCKCFRQNIIQCLALFQTFFELSGLSAKFFVRQCFHLRSESFNLIYDRINTLQLIFTMGSENLLYNVHIP